jgi:hypothetical protein
MLQKRVGLTLRGNLVKLICKYLGTKIIQVNRAGRQNKRLKVL